jgi:translocator protein
MRIPVVDKPPAWRDGVLSFAMTFGAAAIGAAATAQAGDFYLQLQRPDWAPPAAVFGPVWTTLYVLMAMSLWLVWRANSVHKTRLPTWLFLVQLVLNAGWSWLFFAWHQGGWAFVEILVLWSVLLATLLVFWRIKPLAGWLLIPYFTWVSFAAVLNYAVWQLNPTQLVGF